MVYKLDQHVEEYHIFFRPVLNPNVLYQMYL